MAQHIHIHHGGMHVHLHDEFKESEHPRDPAGKFGTGGGSSSSGAGKWQSPIQQKTDHIRQKLKAFGVKARVRKFGNAIQVITPTYEYRWSRKELFEIANAAKANGLTLVRGLPIDPYNIEQLTDTTQLEFHLPVRK